MPAPTSGRDSRRGSRSGGEPGFKNAERREKAKSSQAYSQYTETAGKGSEGGAATRRPQLGTRTTSAPLVERRRGSGYAAGLQHIPQSQDYAAQTGSGAAEGGQDEDEVAGVVGTVRQYEPFRSPQVCAGVEFARIMRGKRLTTSNSPKNPYPK